MDFLFEVEVKKGKNFKGKLYKKNAVIFEGEFKDENLYGRGKITYKGTGQNKGVDTIIEEGFFENNRLIKGKVTSAYDGEYEKWHENGIVHQRGKFISGGKVEFIGLKIDGKKSGDGTFYFKDGDVYQGNFENNKRNGYGMFLFANGDKFMGNFKDGLKEGYGTHIWKNGSKYEGDWKDNERTGKGRYEYKVGEDEGIFYQGEWNNGRYHGKGKYSIVFYGNEGEHFEYEGQFKEGKKSGFGVSTEKFGSMSEFYEGNWANDKYNGHGKLVRKYYVDNNFFYEEQWSEKNVEYDGEDIYTGFFQDGKAYGFGTKNYENGEIYTGDWDMDKRHGLGKLIGKNGELIFEGEWKDEKMFKRSSFAPTNKQTVGAKQKKQFLFFDTETAGLPKNWNTDMFDTENWPRLVQLAYILSDSDGTLIKKSNFIIKPNGFVIPEEASKIHRITNERARMEGVELSEVLNDFKKALETSHAIIAHNINFDINVVGAEFVRTRLSIDFTKAKQICTMKSSTNFCAIKGPYGYKWPKLSELHFKLFNKDFSEAHDALFDIQATEKCFWEMKRLKLVSVD